MGAENPALKLVFHQFLCVYFEHCWLLPHGQTYKGPEAVNCKMGQRHKHKLWEVTAQSRKEKSFRPKCLCSSSSSAPLNVIKELSARGRVSLTAGRGQVTLNQVKLHQQFSLTQQHVFCVCCSVFKRDTTRFMFNAQFFENNVFFIKTEQKWKTDTAPHL